MLLFFESQKNPRIIGSKNEHSRDVRTNSRILVFSVQLYDVDKSEGLHLCHPKHVGADAEVEK